MHEAIARTKEVHESAEIDDLHDGAFIDRTHFRFHDDGADPLHGGINRVLGRRSHLHDTIIIDVDLGTGLFHDLADHLAARADHFADLVGGDVDHFNARGIITKAGARIVECLTHLGQNMQAAFFGLEQSGLHDLFGDAGDLDVHLQGGDAVFGARHLEVHVAQMIFITQNVRQNRKAFAFENEAHGDARDRGLQGHACIHQRQRCAADGGHGRRAVGFGDLRDNADRVGEFRIGRQHRMNGAPSQLAMADFAAASATQTTCFTHREGREVIMQQEGFLVGAFECVNILLVITGAEGGDNQRLGFATGK